MLDIYGKDYLKDVKKKKIDETRIQINFTSQKEEDFVKKLSNKYQNMVIGWSPFSDHVVVDGKPDILNKIKLEIDKAKDKLKGLEIM